jgi:hypothetical protein
VEKERSERGEELELIVKSVNIQILALFIK